MENQSKVKVFVTPACPYCYTLKEFLKEKSITFEEIDISKNEKDKEELIQRSGQIGAPVLEIDGQIVVGFDKEKICQLLKIKE